MTLTLGNWLFLLFFLVIVGGGISAILWATEAKGITIAFSLVTIFLIDIIIMIGINWYNTSTASGIRAYKDFQSELSNGIEREIIITAEDGRQIFHYEGKVDIESNHEDNYIKFESEEGKRYIIYYGIQDTITIIEK